MSRPSDLDTADRGSPQSEELELLSSLRADAPEFRASGSPRRPPGNFTPGTASIVCTPRSTPLSSPLRYGAITPPRRDAFHPSYESLAAFGDCSLFAQDIRLGSPMTLRSPLSECRGGSRLGIASGNGMSGSSLPRSYPNTPKRGPPPTESADGFVYVVQFKRSYRPFLLSPYAPRNIEKGDFVVVEADRGEDLGVVREKVVASEYEEDKHTAGHRGRGFAVSANGENKCLLRIATLEERALIQDKVVEEEITLQVCREKALERGLPMTIVDAEYQFDRHKLTFYFEANRYSS